MANRVRNTSGKFAPKSERPRKIRSVNLTDEAWQWLAAVAGRVGMSRNDYLEALAEGNNPFMEMVSPQSVPLMKTLQTEVNAFREELGAVRAEMLQIQSDNSVEVDRLREELRGVGSENQKLQMELGNSPEVDALRQELTQLRSQLETERADREEIEAQLSELKQNSVPAATLSEKLTPDAATMLSKLRAKRKKSKVELADVEALLELLDES